MMEKLSKNEFMSPYTFEEFIARQNRGKKHYFLKSPNPKQEISDLYNDYVEAIN